MPRAATLPDLSRAIFVSESDVAKACGMSGTEWQIAKLRLMREGFPRPDPIIGGYWSPAVKEFFDKRYGLAAQSGPMTPDGEERWT